MSCILVVMDLWDVITHSSFYYLSTINGAYIENNLPFNHFWDKWHPKLDLQNQSLLPWWSPSLLFFPRSQTQWNNVCSRPQSNLLDSFSNWTQSTWTFESMGFYCAWNVIFGDPDIIFMAFGWCLSVLDPNLFLQVVWMSSPWCLDDIHPDII